jgi:tRNA threonylcarbamoyladenosine biosynthesis protein TsaE
MAAGGGRRNAGSRLLPRLGGTAYEIAAGMTSVVVKLGDEAATGWLAARLAARAEARDVIALSGPLGSGKTSFARAFIRALAVGDEEVPSPTFTLVQTYAFAGRPMVWHFDLYRLERAEEAFELGIEDAFADGIALIEWPARIERLLPRERLEIALAPGDRAEARIATLTGSPRWRAWLEGVAHG